ncbi:MAG: hypothetical protein JW737_05950 [Acidobacteria bacterium]|nr:hypothetical protein [Acidobacteriota bacterium]
MKFPCKLVIFSSILFLISLGLISCDDENLVPSHVIITLDNISFEWCGVNGILHTSGTITNVGGKTANQIWMTLEFDTNDPYVKQGYNVFTDKICILLEGGETKTWKSEVNYEWKGLEDCPNYVIRTSWEPDE